MATANSTKYPRRNNLKKQNIKQTIKTEQPMANENNIEANNQNTNNIEPVETHENFIKPGPGNSGSDAVTLEPTNELTGNPHSSPKIHRGYALDGIRIETHSNGANDDAPQSAKTEPTATAAESDFEPTPPQEGDAPEQPHIEPGAGGDPSAQPFDLPTGTAEELIESGAKALNYLIDNYGDLMVGIRIHQDFYSVPNSVPQIKEQNKRNVEKVKLNQAEINMLKKPLVKIMQEKGIRGLTPGEELIVAVVIIVAGKARAIYQIRQENKKLENNIIAEIRSMRKHNSKFDEQNIKTETSTSSTATNDDDIPLTPAEEVQ